jgi:hypothetical protein
MFEDATAGFANPAHRFAWPRGRLFNPVHRFALLRGRLFDTAIVNVFKDLRWTRNAFS